MTTKERLDELLRLEIGERDRYLEGSFLWLKHEDKANAFAELLAVRALASRHPQPVNEPAEWRETVRDVLTERERQVAKGYDAAHDDQHVDREIIDSMEWGAALRLHQAKWTKDPALYERELIKAAAMIFSEIERSRREVRS